MMAARTLTSPLPPWLREGVWEPSFCPDEAPEPIIKCIDWPPSTPSEGEALWFTGSPRSEWPPVNYLLISQRCQIFHNSNLGSQMTPFTTQRKFLSISCFKHKAGFAFLQKVGARWDAPGLQPLDPSPASRGSSWSWASNDCRTRMSRGLGGAQPMIGGRIWHLFEWILASAEFANLAMASWWA